MTDVSFDEMTALSEAEAKRLAELDAIVRRGVQAFAETGRALREIRDSRLYRQTHATFEDMVRDRYEFSRQRAYQLIAAAEVTTIVDTAPATESQARELAPLIAEPDKLAQVWEAANVAAAEEDRPVTAAHVREARRALDAPAAPTLASVTPIRPKGSPERDSRFEHIVDAVDLLRLLPAPGEVVFPVDEGDVDAVDEAVTWLVDWAPQIKRAWRAHRSDLRGRRAS